MKAIINEDAYGFLLREIKVDIVLISSYLQMDVMVLYYKYGIRPVLLWPLIPEPQQSLRYHLEQIFKTISDDIKHLISNMVSRLDINFRSLQELAYPLDSLHEIIFCPSEFDFYNPIKGPYVHYVGPSIRPADPYFNVYERYNIPAGKKIIYSSMGSQGIRHGRNCDLFFGKVINIMKEKEASELHLILCLGPEYVRTKLGAVPDNVTLLGWGPQIDILPQTSVAILHGGLGGIKECIYHGVPLIILPQGYDQPKNAKRILFHGLGFEGDVETISENKLKLFLFEALRRDDIKFRMSKMQKVFRKKEEEQIGANLIEHLMKYESNHSY
jgi:UDP:flavonoid glycosyltransferase YjiC (YdhE family)